MQPDFDPERDPAAYRASKIALLYDPAQWALAGLVCALFVAFVLLCVAGGAA